MRINYHILYIIVILKIKKAIFLNDRISKGKQDSLSLECSAHFDLQVYIHPDTILQTNMYSPIVFTNK